MPTGGDTFMWHVGSMLNQIGASSGSRTNTSINASFSPGVSGTSVACRYVCPTTSPIVAVYWMADTTTGTYGNITMQCLVVNENSTQAARCGTTTRETSTSTTMPGAADQWSKTILAGTYTPAVGEVLWLCLKNNSAAPATDYVNVLNNGILGPTAAPNRLRAFAGYSTTGGFVANGTLLTCLPFVVEHANGDVYGVPFTTVSSAYYTSNTRKRGIYIPPQPTVRTYTGAGFTAAAALNGLQLFDSATGPGGSALQSWNLGSDSNENSDELIGYKWFDTPVVLAANTAYRFVCTFASNAQVPQVWQIQDYSRYSSIFDKFYSTDRGDLCYSTIDNGAGGWTDDRAISPCIGLVESSAPYRPVVIGG